MNERNIKREKIRKNNFLFNKKTLFSYYFFVQIFVLIKRKCEYIIEYKMDLSALKLPIPLRFIDRHSCAFVNAFCTAMLMQVCLQTSTVSFGNSASNAFYKKEKKYTPIKCQN